MLTDDSGTPGNGKWENNVSAIYEGTRHDYELAFPLFDINYGLGDRIQLKVEFPWVSGYGEPLLNKFDNITVGVKWRFLDEEKDGVSMSVYPQPIFLLNPEDSPKKIEYGIILPAAISKEFAGIAWNAQVGYQILGDEAELFYGLIVSKEVLKSLTVLAEFHQAFDRELHVSEENEVFLKNGSFLNIGAQYEVSELLTLLGAFGKDVDRGFNGESRYYGFAGLQFHM